MSAAADRSERPLTAWNHVRAVVLLPVMNTVIVPALLLLVTRDAAAGTAVASLELAAVAASAIAAAAGLILVIRSIALFVGRGQGTLAPWDPTQVLIVEGVYRYSRNPMKAGLFLVLIGECLLLRSPALAVWAGCFIVVNVLYIRLHEERGLRKRFGEAYVDYCRRVPRWFPTLAARPGIAADAGPTERFS